ncbi:ATP-binding protein [Frankia sp. AiPs1]|uniref:ATP-binding response regulator n=1 Tax=Frankia sp. AiPs1 TaxID=573493 RepID=UPI002044B16B|nr:ATP-binding protein [Frankia sp. AiPs1]MCM3923469.1 ATP-binding protein [Frankia sp. AiPs1]
MGARPDGGPLPELASIRLDGEPDVFTARQLARAAGAAAGLDGPDQVRLATALSEISREALTAGGARIDFVLRNPPALAVVLTADQAIPADAAGLAAAARLVDLTVRRAGPGAGGAGSAPMVVTLAKPLAPGVVVDDAQRTRLRQVLAATVPLAPADELRVQNSELVGALAQLRDNQNELLRLNAELEETNRGVMALYSQLSAELEETNRGVVALYGELDERSIALTRANEAKTRFLRSVSHELRAPVNSVLGLARLLVDPAGDPLTAEQRRQVELILASTKDLLALVNDLLDLSKAESGRLEPALEQVDIRAVLAHLDGSLRPLANRPGVDLVIEEDGEVGPLYTDETLLGRVLRNLVGNALKFTEHGEVRVTAARTGEAGETVTFVVRDTGIGISAHDIEQVFQEFYQAHSHLHARTRGTGLGLPYARRVCELLGGRLDLASELGRGSTFTVTLPRDLGAHHRADSEDGADSPLAPGEVPVRVRTALVVDDDPAFRATMRRLLADRADRVLEAGDGLEAFAALRAGPPDVVFLDLLLPGMDGGEVLAAMGADPALRDIPVVIVTWSDHDARRGRGPGSAVAVLAKLTLSQRAIDAVLARVDALRP